MGLLFIYVKMGGKFCDFVNVFIIVIIMLLLSVWLSGELADESVRRVNETERLQTRTAN